MSMQLISYVFPVYNQADHIQRIVTGYHEALTGKVANFEFILVVNGSRDNSVEECRQLTQKYSNVRMVEVKLGGWGRAVRLGLSEAKGDLICYTNSARTQAKELVLVSVYATIYPEVIVKAYRKCRDSLVRRLGSVIYNLEARMLFDLANWDVNGTPKIFNRSHGKLLELKSPGDLLDVEFLAVCRKENYPIIEVPVYASDRHGGKSTTNWNSAFRMYWGACDMYLKMKRGQW